jgi:glucuronate isomerase
MICCNKTSFTALNIVKGFGVELLCTSDDLNDSLEHHIELSKQPSGLTCLPSLRADSIISFNQPSFHTWLESCKPLHLIK